ncbi:MAG TPA: tetratricopeptide repeat protein [Sphingomonadaceae bacterium]|nr:tetratricopeptide repeat protein [Sphingomonadaceae bacterium]
MTTLCSDDELQELMAAMQADSADELERADRLVAIYPEDARLHFLRGSILANIGRPIEALPALKRSVELAPDFSLARFQTGFFQLTSGEAADALGTWGPLAMLPADNYLRMFVAGLTHLIRDEFAEAVAQLEAGIAANEENPPLNRDMQLIIDQTTELMAGAPAVLPEETGSASATSFLLGQFDRGRPN